MKKRTILNCIMLAGIMTFPSVLVADDNTPEEEKVIILTGQNNQCEC